jgi:signal transduction histidine kinase
MTAARSLLGLVARRILLFALLAVSIQSMTVFVHYWFDEAELGRIMIEHETETIASALTNANEDPDIARIEDRYGIWALTPSGDDDEAEEEGRPGYWIRVREAGRIVFTNCGEECTEHFLPLAIDPPDFWDRTVTPGKPLSIAGGRSFQRGDGSLLTVEFASIRDPRGLVRSVLAQEMVEHMVWPMGLMLFLVIGATTLSIRAALRPVEEAVAAADAIDPARRLEGLPEGRLPSEILRLVRAVNRAFGRVEELIRSQKIFAASIAHEIRTPVSIVKLELARIDNPRARKAEGDLDSLTHVLEQLTALARLDATEGEAFTIEPLADLVEGVVEDIAPLVYKAEKSIAFERTAEPRSRVSRSLLTTLVRNLVENAIKHTPKGTGITVRVEAPATITVIDDGPGFSRATTSSDAELASVKSSGSMGVGLKIADRIAGILGGSLAIASGEAGGTRVTVVLPAA